MAPRASLTPHAPAAVVRAAHALLWACLGLAALRALRSRRPPAAPTLPVLPPAPVCRVTEPLTVAVGPVLFRGQVESIYIEDRCAVVRLRDRLLAPLDPAIWRTLLDRDADALPPPGED